MSKINDGGPAFPRPHSTDEHEFPCNGYDDQQGMTLRDWFAGQALAEIYNNYWREARERDLAVPSDWRMGLAQESYAMADAMIAARGAS